MTRRGPLRKGATAPTRGRRGGAGCLCVSAMYIHVYVYVCVCMSVCVWACERRCAWSVSAVCCANSQAKGNGEGFRHGMDEHETARNRWVEKKK